MPREIVISISGDANQYTATVDKIIQKNRELNKDAIQGAQQTVAALRVWETALTGIGSLLTGLIGGFGILRAINFVEQFARGADELGVLSARIGVAVEELSALGRVAELNRGNAEDLGLAFKFLGISVAQASDKTSDQAKIFRALGIDAQGIIKSGGNLKDVMFALSDAFKNNLDESNRLLASRLLLGRSSEGLINVLALGRQELERQIIVEKQAGVVTTETAEASNRLIDAWKEFKAVASVKIGTVAIDFLGSALKDLNTIIELATRNFAVFFGQLRGGRIGADLGGMKDIIEGTKTAAGATEDLKNKNIDLAAALKQEDIFKKQAEALNQATTKVTALALAYAQAERAAGDLSIDVRSLAIASIEQEAQAAVAAAKANETYTVQLGKRIEQEKTFKIAQFDLAESVRKRNEAFQAASSELQNENADIQEVTEAWRIYYELLSANKNAEIDHARALANLDAEILEAARRPQDAARARLIAEIAENQQRIDAIRKGTISGSDQDIELLLKKTDLAEVRMQQLGVASVNIGEAISSTVNDIFTAAIQGTLKLSDIGKSLLAGAARTAGDFLTQILNKKLGFENIILTNMQGLPSQMNGAVAAGVSQLPGGGIFSSLFGGGGGGGGGGGFDFGSILQFLGLGGGGGLGPNTTFSLAPENIFGAFPAPSGGSSFSFGAGITGGIIGLIQAALTGGFSKGQIGSTIGGTLGGIGGGIAGSFFGPIGTILGSFLGSTLGKFLGALFGGVPNPTVAIRAKFSGIFYDAVLDQFKQGTVTTDITKTKDIDSKTAAGVRNQVQTILEGLSKQWTDILNVFPSIVRQQMIPSLDRANEILNTVFGRLKFTEGGSNNIADEIRLLQTVSGPRRFFFALRETIGKGIEAALNLAGLGDAASLVSGSFTGLPENVKITAQALQAKGLKPPKKASDIEAFVQALQSFAGITGGLASVSPRGVGQFLSEQDLALLNDQIQGVLKITEGNAFSKGVKNLQDALKPVLDFLQQSVQQTTQIFGRGLIAALSAASESQAILAFQQNLGQGVKDLLFQGITEAFIASAQFNDLLAPIQKIIRDFTQQAIATGQTPDINAFRQAIFPQIEEITTRASLLEPLIAEFQRLGSEIKNAIGGNGGTAGQIIINIEGNVNSADDARELARRLEDLLRGQLAPPQ